MDPVLRESALWGVTSGFLFLVLTFGYRLATDAGISLPAVVITSVAVGFITAGLSYVVDTRFA